MRRAEVLSIAGIHNVTLWRLIRRGEFPKPVHVTSKAVAWRRAEVARWLAELK
jgi:prophage regulatory protein